ncbi:MAG: DUF1266 domain-containing protein [Lachnoclostridium sp.]|nr:DUF1266 domain-containing protein [Lachnospira sp.]MCM1247930.1 DUF1266 domain-containing protein [Lachnoclostridium sp.]MCM1536218.1 DUF1266 domain-containing protein [Clostridium sp.]
MELICRHITTNKIEKIFRSLGLFSMAVALTCFVSGCGFQAGNEKDDTKTQETIEEELSQSADAEKEAKPVMAQLLEDAGNGIEELPDTVLWFNATYAPLTYNNGGEWRIVGGEEITEDYQVLVQNSLRSSWSIRDRETALETVEQLQKEGHRKVYRECLEELEKQDMLSMTEEEFAQALENSGIKENLFRYVIVYALYQGGEDEEAIAAWDLCRVNQLYADFYVCGYMSYEEAMEKSLENSLKLQKKYDSWEELVNSYMLGYQFWQSDPGFTENSPTMMRYQCYEMLNKMEDGPYSLDWNMRLKKSW